MPGTRPLVIVDISARLSYCKINIVATCLPTGIHHSMNKQTTTVWFRNIIKYLRCLDTALYNRVTIEN